MKDKELMLEHSLVDLAERLEVLETGSRDMEIRMGSVEQSNTKLEEYFDGLKSDVASSIAIFREQFQEI